MNPLRHLADELTALNNQGRLREGRLPPSECLALCSNDYLGLLADPPADLQTLGASPSARGLKAGAGASRLVSGNNEAHLALERCCAEWVQLPAALVFSSGYAANVGAMSALAGAADVIISDALNHASIIDGCRLSRARTVVVPHADLAAVETALKTNGGARARLVVTESYFSMDGDRPNLVRLRELCDRFDAALLVDDAHALGVWGPGGGGGCLDQGVVPDLLVGTFGKSVGVAGAFVAGSQVLRQWLWNRARSFVFSTGISPVTAVLAQQHIDWIRQHPERAMRLHEVVSRFRKQVSQNGAPPLAQSSGPIVPFLMGPERAAMDASAELERRGIFVQAIRPPTVPEGASRLRVTLHAGLKTDEIDTAARAIADVVRSTQG